jgi:hypothetical protein
MLGVPVMIAATLAVPAICPTADPEHRPDVSIVVFRHHPGLIDTEERMTARDADEKVILKAVKKAGLSLDYTGGLGRGYQLFIGARDLGRWKATIDALHKAGSLRYYRAWGLDRQGYGLVPVR